MTHANAALTVRARLRLARLIVDDGWSPARAAERYDVAWRTAAKWAARYRAEGEAGMHDRSSRPHRRPNLTRAPLVRKILHLRRKRRWGPVPIAGQLGLAASTVHAVLTRHHANRLSHLDRSTGEPIRRYEHPAPGDLLHVDVKKPGNIPDGGGHRFLDRPAGERNRRATARRTGQRRGHAEPRIGTAYVHTVIDDHSRVAYAEIHDDEPPPPPPPYSAAPSPGTPNTASPPAGSCPTTAPPTDPTAGPPPAPNSASPRRKPAHTGHKPTAKSNGSTAPSPTAGPSPSSTPQNKPAAKPYPPSSTTTTTTDPTPPSAAPHP